MDTTMIKALLWMLLAASVAANVFLGFAWDGILQLLLSVVSGAVGLAAAAGLVAVGRATS